MIKTLITLPNEEVPHQHGYKELWFILFSFYTCY